MQVIFLEFDGVLHPASATSRFALGTPLKRAVQDAWLFRWAWILDDLLSGHVDVGIVTHSNWRLLAHDDELQSLLGPIAGRFIGSTPRTERWPSIAAVVRQNSLRDYLILDALPTAFPPDLPQLVACDPEAGLKDFKVQVRLWNWLKHPH